jgi:hypothetical protein
MLKPTLTIKGRYYGMAIRKPLENIRPSTSLLDSGTGEIIQPGLSQLIGEYTRLSTQSTLSDADTKRLIEISALAEYDDELENWLMRIDENMDLILIGQEFQKKPFGLKDFILAVKNTPPNEMTLEAFTSLAKKVKFRDDFLAEHINFDDRERKLTMICATLFGSIFIGAWKPGQGCCPHLHDNSLSVTQVLKGKLTHYLCQELKFDKPGSFRRIQKDKISAGEWISIDLNQMHELVNEEPEDLVTLHFRFFNTTLLRERLNLDDLAKQEVLHA